MPQESIDKKPWAVRMSRRDLLSGLAGTAALAAFGSPAHASSSQSQRNTSLCIFSKHLQWLDWRSMAETAAELGFDGVDLTVRPGGHVSPERVDTDLPKAVTAIRQAGLDVPMITTEISGVESPHAEEVLKIASQLKIRHYRCGGLRFTEDLGLAERLKALKPGIEKLAKLNRTYDICAMYHTHSGAGRVGASFWDLWLLFDGLDSNWMSVNFDVGHATIEGGLGGWLHSARLLAQQTRGIAIKDFRWERNAQGEWRPAWCPLGEGMVDFKRYLNLLKAANFSGPIQLHYEYPLGGADHGARELSVDKQQVLSAMRKDLDTMKNWLRAAELI